MGSEEGKRQIVAASAMPQLVMYLDRDERRAVPASLDTPIPIILTDENNNPITLLLDETTGAIVTMDYAHHEVHEQRHFIYSNAQDIGISTTINFTIVTPDTTRISNFGFMINGEVEWDLQLFEGATGLTSVGTPVSNPPVINNDRNSVITNGMVINATPTLGGGSKGTLIWRSHAGSGRSIGGAAGTGEELRLKRNTIYWIDLANISNSSANFIDWIVEWYEHIDK